MLYLFSATFDSVGEDQKAESTNNQQSVSRYQQRHRRWHPKTCGSCVMMWPAQTVGHILYTILCLGPDDVTWRNEPSRSQNTSAILEAPLQPTIFATSPPVSLLPGSQMRLKNYLNSLHTRRIKLNKSDLHNLIRQMNMGNDTTRKKTFSWINI